MAECPGFGDHGQTIVRSADEFSPYQSRQYLFPNEQGTGVNGTPEGFRRISAGKENGLGSHTVDQVRGRFRQTPNNQVRIGLMLTITPGVREASAH